MELFAKLFSSLLVFVYHCFDRVVLGIPVVSKEAMSQRTNDYRAGSKEAGTLGLEIKPRNLGWGGPPRLGMGGRIFGRITRKPDRARRL